MSEMVEAPAIAWPKSPAQLRALDQIGCGNYSPIMAKKTRDMLLANGLIERLPDRVDRAGGIAIRFKEYQMPLAVHLMWCASCVDDAALAHPEKESG